jgi:uncharacterized peroxidase-related enzyme
MPRLKALTKSDADPKAHPFFDAVEKKLGKVPNIMKTMANAPAVLEAYLGFSGALAKGSLPPKLREQIALAVGEQNHCGYCVAAHSALGQMAGLSDDEVVNSRRGAAADPKSNAALAFARKIVTERGHVSDQDVETVRKAGFDDGAIAEIVSLVALNIFTNYFNHVADPEIDFPKVEPIDAKTECAC